MLSAPAFAHKIIGIANDDTMTLLVDCKPLKIRLANIDAPEKAQPYGNRSRESLSDMCWGKKAHYEPQSIDRYGKMVAIIICDGVEANREQVKQGMAWVYPKYNKGRILPAIQEHAFNDRRRLWADPDPMPPWELLEAAGLA